MHRLWTRCATSASRWQSLPPALAPRAEDALDRVEVEYDPLPAVATTEAAAVASAPLIYDELGSNVAWQGHVSYGDVESAFARADRIVRDNLKIHRYSSTPLEPFACLAETTAGRLTMWCNAQSPEVVYEALSEALGLDSVRVIVPDVGGGFGQKIHLIRKYAVLTALMAIQTGRPVKWIEDRSEHMMAGGHSCEQEFDVEAAVTGSGEVLGLKILDTDDVGGSVGTLTIHFTNKLNNLFNTYKVQHLRLEGRSVLTNKCPVVPNRGIGKPGMCFVWERIMDRIAQELGLDPVEVRRRNLIGADQFPYTTPNGNIYGSGDYQALLDKALAKVGYDEIRRQQAEQRTRRIERSAERSELREAIRTTYRPRRGDRHRAGRAQRRARHGDLSQLDADAWRRRGRRRHGQDRKERLGGVHARVAELRAVARDDGVTDRRRRAGRGARTCVGGGDVRHRAVSLGRLLVQQRQQFSSL